MPQLSLTRLLGLAWAADFLFALRDASLRRCRPARRALPPAVEPLEPRWVPASYTADGVVSIDPIQATPYAFGRAVLYPQNGNLSVQQNLDATAGTAWPFGDPPALVYNAQSVTAQPIVQITTGSFATVPTALSAQLTWNNGTPQPPVSFATTGHSAGDSYALALQVASPVTATGIYAWSVSGTASFGGGFPRILSGSGTVPVVVSPNADPFGQGWSVAGADQLVSVSGGVLYVYGSGGARFFAAAGGGAFTSPANDTGTLTQSQQDSTYTYTAKGQVQWHFSSAGVLTSVTDPHNLAITYGYSGGLLQSITGPDGGALTFTYTAGLLSGIAEPGGRTVSVTVNGSGNLTGLTLPDGARRTFTYDTAHHLTGDQLGTTAAAYTYNATTGALATATLGAGGTLSVAPANAVALATNPAVNASAVLGVLTDPDGHARTYTLDGLGRATQLQQPGGVSWQDQLNGGGLPSQSTDADNHVTAYQYDNSSGAEDLTKVTHADNTTAQYAYEQTFHRPTTITDGNGHTTTRTYDSITGDLLTSKDALGKVTTYTYYQSGGLSNGLVQTVTDPDGNVTRYTYDSSRRVMSMVQGYGSSAAATTLYAYDAAGNRTSVTDPDGNVTHDAYDGLRRLTQQTRGYGSGAAATTSYAYDAAGDQTTVTDADGHVTQTSYDGAGRVTTVIAGYGSAAATTTTLSYDAAGNLLSQTTGYSSNGSYSHPSTTTYAYDALNRVTATVTGYGTPQAATVTTTYDNAGNVLTVTDADGNVTSYGYDALNRVTTEIRGYGTAAAATTTTTYDAAGNVLSKTTGYSPTTGYSHPSTTSYAYDADNRITAVTTGYGTPQAATVTTAYDAAGNVTSVTDADGNVTSYSYDALNRQVTAIAGYGTVAATTITTVYDAAGNVTARTTGYSSNGGYSHPSTTSYAYDALNRQTTATAGYGTSVATTTTTSYDAAGNVLSRTTGYSSNGGYSHPDTTTYAYDVLNRLTQQTDAYGVSGVQRTTSTAYDAAGNAVARTAGLGHATTTAYDALNRPTSVTDLLGHTATTTYDADGNVLSVTDANNLTTRYAYDPLNRRTTTTDPRNDVTTETYDAAGNEVSLQDADNNVTTFAYDAQNRVSSQTDPLNHTSTFAYDANGNQTSATDRDGRTNTLSYDALNRRTAETQAGGATLNTLTYTYDAVGNQVTAANAQGTYTLIYDALNRATNVQEPHGFAMTFSYDAAGDRTLVQDSFGGTTTSVYDALGELTSRQFAGTGQAPLRLDQTYDADGQVSGQTRYSDLAGTQVVATTSFTYDNAGRLTDEQHKLSGGANLGHYTYSYDVGNRLTTASTDGVATTYTYDNSNEVTGDGTATYTFDATGNRTNTGYATGTGNQLTSDGTWTYSYDAEGNVTEKLGLSNGLAWTYGYDNHNRLTVAKEYNGDPAHGGTLALEEDTKYDAFGNQVERDLIQGSTTVSRFAYDGWESGFTPGGGTGDVGWNVFADLDGSNALQTRYVRGNAADELFARLGANSSVVLWELTDRQGSVRLVLDGTGAVQDKLAYDAWGNIASETNPGARGRYAYTGRPFDGTTGLQDNRARDYNPQAGRWQTQDPLGLRPDSDPYRYVGNGPTDGADPSGLDPPGGPIAVNDLGYGPFTGPTVVQSSSARYTGGGRSWWAPIGNAITGYDDPAERVARRRIRQLADELWYDPHGTLTPGGVNLAAEFDRQASAQLFPRHHLYRDPRVPESANPPEEGFLSNANWGPNGNGWNFINAFGGFTGVPGTPGTSRGPTAPASSARRAPSPGFSQDRWVKVTSCSQAAASGSGSAFASACRRWHRASPCRSTHTGARNGRCNARCTPRSSAPGPPPR